MADSEVPPSGVDAALSRLGVELSGVDPSIERALRALVATNQALSERIDGLSAELDDARALADRDPLCPLLNRRAFTRELAREIALATRHKTSLALLFLDLDGFKQVNDQLGHHAGDEILKAVANALTSGVRRTDIVGRLGGDEFGVILVRASQLEADAQLARLTAHLDNRITDTYSVTTSIGLATWQAEQSVDDLMAAADRSMFDHKSEKRRQTSHNR